MTTFEVILFYKYVGIGDPEKLARSQKSLQEKLGLKGRTIIAREGINATLEGRTEHIAEYLRCFLADPRFASTHIKRSPGTGNAFPKTSVKVRPEIVSLGLSACDVDPNKLTGIHLPPAELHHWLRQGKEFYIIDMRNAYEHQVGHFRNSLLPPMDNFRDLPKFLASIAHLKHKTVLTVCTGGVRCEKASGYLLQNGFTDVYQLDGGIVSYMEQYPNEDFVGKLYVFDNRMMMGFYTDDPNHAVVGACTFCSAKTENFTNCARQDCHRQLLACPDCAAKAVLLCPDGCKKATRKTPAKLTQFIARTTTSLVLARSKAQKKLKAIYGKNVTKHAHRLKTLLSGS